MRVEVVVIGGYEKGLVLLDCCSRVVWKEGFREKVFKRKGCEEGFGWLVCLGDIIFGG